MLPTSELSVKSDERAQNHRRYLRRKDCSTVDTDHTVDKIEEDTPIWNRQDTTQDAAVAVLTEDQEQGCDSGDNDNIGVLTDDATACEKPYIRASVNRAHGRRDGRPSQR